MSSSNNTSSTYLSLFPHTIRDYISSIATIEPVFHKEETALRVLLLSPDQSTRTDALNRLIRGNLWLVAQIALPYTLQHPHLAEDIISAGNLWLMERSTTYVASRGSFSAYVSMGIRHSIQRLIESESRYENECSMIDLDED